MSKKNRPRHKSGKGKPARRLQSPPNPPASPVQAGAAVAARAEQPSTQPLRPLSPAVTARSTRAATQFIQTNYEYVVSDLKRIGIIAGGMFGALIVLAVIIR